MPRRAPVIAAAVVALAAMVVLGIAAFDGVRAVANLQSHRLVAASAASNRQLACLEHRVQVQLPAGTTVAIGPSIPLYEQRLTEWATPRARVVAEPTAAAYVLRVRKVAGGPCGGRDVEVTPR